MPDARPPMPDGPPGASDDRPVRARVEAIGRRLASHAGGAELLSFTDGVAHLRLTGQCTGCPCTAMCVAGTVRPGLLALDGVSGVEVRGHRVSDEAQERLEELLSGHVEWSQVAAEGPHGHDEPSGE